MVNEKEQKSSLRLEMDGTLKVFANFLVTSINSISITARLKNMTEFQPFIMFFALNSNFKKKGKKNLKK
jgi:hypothetical protein